MIDQRNTQQDSGTAETSVVWPDPSPLSSWWDAVMRGDSSTPRVSRSVG
ncbi:hypothetical protein ACWDSJ_25635 [Nocardia sp. NPDC003482]